MSLNQSTLQGIKARLAEAEAILANQPLTQDYQHQTLATLCSCLYALTLELLEEDPHDHTLPNQSAPF